MIESSQAELQASISFSRKINFNHVKQIWAVPSRDLPCLDGFLESLIETCTPLLSLDADGPMDEKVEA